MNSCQLHDALKIFLISSHFPFHIFTLHFIFCLSNACCCLNEENIVKVKYINKIMFSMFYLKNPLNARFRFQVYTRLNYLKFEISKFFWGGAHRAPFPDPSLFLGLRPRFGLRPQISGASRPRFGLHPIRTPQLLKRGGAPVGKQFV